MFTSIHSGSDSFSFINDQSRKIKTASHDHDPYKGPNDTLRTRTRTTHTSSFYFLQGRRTVQPTIIMNLPREFCTIWTATPLVTPICQLPCHIPTTYSCLFVSYLRYRYPFKKSSCVRSRPSSPFFVLFGLEVLDRTRCWYPGRVEMFLYLADQCLTDIYIRIVYWMSSNPNIYF